MMEYLVVTLVAAVVWVIFVWYTKRQKRLQTADQMAAAWGKIKKSPYVFRHIRRYADVIRAPGFRLTEQTMVDIDLEDLFTVVDRTTSKVGQQYLFKRILEPSDRRTNPNEPCVKKLMAAPDFRKQIQSILGRLAHDDAYFIATLLQDSLLKQPEWINFVPITIVMIIGLLLLSLHSAVFLVWLLLPLTINMLVSYWNKSYALQFLKSFPQLNVLIDVAKQLNQIPDLSPPSGITKSIRALRPFQRQSSFINVDQRQRIGGELSGIATYFLQLFSAFLLIEVLMLYRAVEQLSGKRSHILALFDFVGEVDACLSIASLRSGSLPTCIPKLTERCKEVAVINVYHPLIDDCATNTLHVKHKSILITGSNMSGKSTFLRTMIINSILAQTIYTCFAEAFCSPVFRQFSSIRIDDDLFQGTSYFFQEVKTIGSLVTEAGTQHQALFVLDEVFKGTNTMERVSAAKAILSYLNRNLNLVIVATHDIELAEMLKEEYDLYHFTETIENDNLAFDYKIKSGQLKTRNAIRILELSGYPSDIVREATRLSAGLTSSDD